MQHKTEMRDGKEYRVTVLPEAFPHARRPQTTRWQMRDVGKNPNKKPGKPIPAGRVNAPTFSATKFPFAATINGQPVIVWPDWIERPEGDALR